MRNLGTVLSNMASRASASTRNLSPVPYVGDLSAFGNSDDTTPPGDRAYTAFGSVGTLFAIVSQRGYAIASTDWHLYQRTSVRDKKRRKEILNDPFLTVWNKPNNFMTGQMFRRTVQQHLDLVGEGVIVLNAFGDFVYEMWPVRPDRIQPVRHPTKFLTGYIYTGPDGEEVPLELDRVIHIKLPNPGDLYRGMGPVQACLNDIDASRYSAEWNKNFFINGAKPGGVIKVDYKMSDDEFNNFVRRWRTQHQGVANAHRVAVLENADWKDTNFSMTDMQFVELRNLPRELIREAFAFPKPMLGTVDDVNRANAQAGREIMAEQQTRPALELWKDVINNFLIPLFPGGDTRELDYDDPTPLNVEDANAQRNSQTQSFRNLVLSGVDPADAALVCGLPEMRWIGIPSPNGTPMQSDTLPDFNPGEAPDGSSAPGNRRTKKLIDLV